MTSCELCSPLHPAEFYRNDLLYIIDANDPTLPGYLRIVLIAHVKEMTDLPEKDILRLTRTLCQVESVMRRVMKPEKVNWAQFGNMVPHLHWHLIPRYKDDGFFPGSVWSMRVRETSEDILKSRRNDAERMKAELKRVLNESASY